MYHLWVNHAPGPAPDVAATSDGVGQADFVSLKDSLRDMLRLAAWRRPRHPRARMSNLAMIRIFLGATLVFALAQFATANGELSRFNPYGLSSLIAVVGVEAAVIARFANVDRSQATMRHLMLVYGAMICIALVEYGLIDWAAAAGASRKGPLTPAALALTAMSLLTYVWFAGAARQAFKAAGAVRRPTLRAIAFVVCLAAAASAVPTWPAFVPDNFDRSNANLMEWAWAFYSSRQAGKSDDGQAARRAAEARAARLEAAQGPLLDAALKKLAPRDPQAANVYTIGVAGWGYQDVFLKEIQQSTDILKSRFGFGDRTLRLINNAATQSEAPIASMQNLGAALRAVAARMDRDRDLLVLVLSSHGSPYGFALNYGDLVDRTLDPETLRRLLDEAGVRNRIVIVSSCYSGAFIAPLETPDTMILTAAASDRTSFGCADDRKWTWFGEALFQKGLTGRATLAEAFAAAKTTIATWEREQKLTPSNPQIFVGDEIARQFPAIVGKPPPTSLGAGETSATIQRE